MYCLLTLRYNLDHMICLSCHLQKEGSVRLVRVCLFWHKIIFGKYFPHFQVFGITWKYGQTEITYFDCKITPPPLWSINCFTPVPFRKTISGKYFMLKLPWSPTLSCSHILGSFLVFLSVKTIISLWQQSALISNFPFFLWVIKFCRLT